MTTDLYGGTRTWHKVNGETIGYTFQTGTGRWRAWSAVDHLADGPFWQHEDAYQWLRQRWDKFLTDELFK